MEFFFSGLRKIRLPRKEAAPQLWSSNNGLFFFYYVENAAMVINLDWRGTFFVHINIILYNMLNVRVLLYYIVTLAGSCEMSQRMTSEGSLGYTMFIIIIYYNIKIICRDGLCERIAAISKNILISLS